MLYIFSAPARWPRSLGIPGFSAHLPLPSGTMATWVGSRENFLVDDVFSFILPSVVECRGVRLDLHNFYFFIPCDFFNIRYKAIGQLLYLVLETLVLVLRNILILFGGF